MALYRGFREILAKPKGQRFRRILPIATRHIFAPRYSERKPEGGGIEPPGPISHHPTCGV
jgi:hypothetical protein